MFSECSSTMLLPSGRSNSDGYTMQATQKPQLLTRISSPQLAISSKTKPENTTLRETTNTEPLTEHTAKTVACTNSSSPASENGSSCSSYPHHIPRYSELLGGTAVAVVSSIGNWTEIDRNLQAIQEKLKEDWTVHVAKEGRLYYCNHAKKTAGWLPSCEDWSKCEELPYGWERAIDSRGRSYYINHVNKTSTYEAPENIRWDQNPPKPRVVIIQRSETLGFGFVAGSERPVIVRFVTDGGPSINKLQPGDQILAVDGEDVKEAPRDHVIQLVRACESQVTLLVCQPSHTLAPGRKSTLLSAGKRAKLRTRPSRVRFAESVCVNGSPLFPASAFSLGDICVPPMANVLKVFLENGQTKSFKYDATTTVQDVVGSLLDKLCLNTGEIFSLVLEHVKSLKRNKLTLLDPEESLARIAARPGAHKLRCLFRVTFVPKSASDLAQKDLNAFDYLYMQCCNDVTQERFAPELQPEIALRLAALHMHQHALANNVSPAKLTVKVVEREFGLERFVPITLFEGMKRKELRRLISHFLKLNGEMTGSSTKLLTQLQSKLHYLDIIASLPSYGAKCFSTNQREGVERVLLISPRFGLSQISSIRNSVPQPISAIEDFNHVNVSRDDDVTCSVTIYMRGDKLIKFSMEDRDACEFSLVLSGYYRLLTGKKLQVEREREQINEDNAPSYLAQHTVLPATWSYLANFHNRAHSINFLMMPAYHPLSNEVPMAATENNDLSESNNTNENQRERNMNNSNIVDNNQKPKIMPYVGNTVMDLDIHSVMATELLEEAKDSGMSDSSGGGSNYCDGSNCLNTTAFIEARNEEVLRRVHEMQKMVQNSEQYLNEQGELVPEYAVPRRSGVYNSNFYGNITSKQTEILNTDQNITKIGGVIEFDSDCESINSSKVSSTEDTPQSGALKHSDSLVLLAEAINHDLNGITRGLNSIGGNQPDLTLDITSISATCSPRADRKFNNIGQLLSNLQLSSEFSQSESDSESVTSPTSSPTARRTLLHGSVEKRVIHKQNLAYRSSFGLHSPDGNNFGPDNKDYNLKEYLKQLKEISNIEDGTQDTDMAAKKLSEIYGFEIRGDTFIETDGDLIDLRAIPPPRTPDELDSISLLNAAPQGFDDGSKKMPVSDADGDLDTFLAKVVVAPPTQKATPAKELTPEEIMSFIIPPPPKLEELENFKQKNNISENLYSNSMLEARSFLNQTSEHIVTNVSSNQNTKTKELGEGTHVIEYATVERRSKFSCCPKSTKDESAQYLEESNVKDLQLPPRSKYSDKPPPPIRPPKSAELIQRFSPKKQRSNTETSQKTKHNISKTTNKLPEEKPPLLPPRISTPRRLEDTCHIELVSELPKKPPLPAMANRPSPRDIHLNVTNSINERLSPIPPLTSPRICPISIPSSICSNTLQSNYNNSPTPNSRQISSSDYPPTFLQNPAIDKRSPISLLSSPQMTRKYHNSGPVAVAFNPNIAHKFGEKYIIKNGHVIDSEALLAKTDIAMAGLLVKLDQVAAQCSAAQLAGGGINIDEDKFQRARNELTEQTLVLVTASKFLVVAMSDMTLSTLPEHLTSCLTAIRRITELTQDMTRHTSSPLQTRNIVLKVHDVSSSFRELVCVKIGPLGAGQLALQAECLANVLATLLRSLRVFSP